MENKKRRTQRSIALFFAMMLVLSCVPEVAAPSYAAGSGGGSASGAGTAAVTGAVTETVTETRTITDIGSYDIWKHINGTWQYGKKKGSAVSVSPTIYIAGRLPEGAKVKNVKGSFDSGYSGSFSRWAVPSGRVSIRSFNDRYLTYSLSTALNGNPMNLRQPAQSEYTEGYRYYLPSKFEITYTLEKVKDAGPGTDGPGGPGGENGTEEGQEAVPGIDGTADLELPSRTYEGHTVKAEDRSVFNVEGRTYSAYSMYGESLASNRFRASGGGSIRRRDSTTADVTFARPGTENVQLSIRTKGGGSMSDQKSIDVLGTPYISAELSGTRKENRKQVLSVSVAVNPAFPLTEMWIEIERKGGSDKVRLLHNTEINEGYGSNAKSNSSLIKTRPIKACGSDRYFVRTKLEFLTKNKDEEVMTYRIFTKDTRGREAEVEKDFTVAPDLAPQVVIGAEDPQFRKKGTNTALVYAEDRTLYDGDDSERTWYAKENGQFSEEGISDASFGTKKGIVYKKTGVGKVTLRLDVKDKWTEETLPEYVNENDRKTGSATISVNVDNIAPHVSLSAEKMKRGNLLMLAADDREEGRFRAEKSKIEKALMERGISTGVKTERLNSEEELNRENMPRRELYMIRSYGHGAEDTFLEKNWYICDSRRLYTIDGTWSENPAYRYIHSYTVKAPYTINAYSITSPEGEDPADTPEYSITVSQEQLGNAGIKDIKNMAQDDTETYLYLITKDRTLIYDKKTGALCAAVPLSFGTDNYVAEKRIYTLKDDGLYCIDMRSGRIKSVYKGDIVMKASYCDDAGSSRRINNEINFITGKGSILKRMYFDPDSEDMRSEDMMPQGAEEHDTYTIAGFSSDGDVCIGSRGMSRAYVFDRNGQEKMSAKGWDASRGHYILPVYRSDGNFDNIAVAANSYSRSGTRQKGYKYRYGINVYIYPVDGGKAPLVYSYQRKTGGSGTSGSGTDAGKAMYALQVGKDIIVDTGNWSTCISDGSSLSAYYCTSFTQIVFDTEKGTSKAYKGGAAGYDALNCGGVLCEYGKIYDDVAVSAYSNVASRYMYGEGLNRQMIKVSRLPKTMDAEVASGIERFAPVKGSAGLDSAAVLAFGALRSPEDQGIPEKGGAAPRTGIKTDLSLKNAENILISPHTEEETTDISVISQKMYETGGITGAGGETGDGMTLNKAEGYSPVKRVKAPVYKKGEDIKYGVIYTDYENDKSKRQYWKYTHIPGNDGPDPDAGKILDAPVTRFYTDGKYKVEHWQEDSTGDPLYDRKSNVAETVFYIEGMANAPWIESIRLSPGRPEEGDGFRIAVKVGDHEKDVLDLTTEVRLNGKLIYTHRNKGLSAGPSGTYPEVYTGYIPGGAVQGSYSVVCTVRDAEGSGLGFYDFRVESSHSVKGRAEHFPAWEKKRLSHNAKDPAHQRGSNTYWPQESLLLKALVKGNASKVTASLEQYPGRTAALIKNSDGTYSGSFYDSATAAKLAEKGSSEITIIFTAEYPDGTKAKDRVYITVDGTNAGGSSIHRVK